MKHVREFWFIPSWESRGFSYETRTDRYPLPSFNEICEFLENNGWEIHSWEYVEDEGVLGYHKRDDMRSLKVYAIKDTEFPKIIPNANDKSYYIHYMTKDGLSNE